MPLATTRHPAIVIGREGGGCIALCPELDIASLGSAIEQSQLDPREAPELLFEAPSPLEVQERLRSDGMRSDALRRAGL